MERSISIRQVIDDIMVHPLLQDLTLERCANYAVDFMRIVDNVLYLQKKHRVG